MKNFFSKRWKRIVYIITALIVFFNTAKTIVTPNRIIDDFYDYGPDYAVTLSNKSSNNQDSIKDEAEDVAVGLTDSLADKANIPPELARGIVIFTCGFLIILIISNILEGGKAQPAKKK